MVGEDVALVPSGLGDGCLNELDLVVRFALIRVNVLVVASGSLGPTNAECRAGTS